MACRGGAPARGRGRRRRQQRSAGRWPRSTRPRSHEVVLLRAGELPRTTSGKVRRRACREAWLAGTLRALTPSVRLPQPPPGHPPAPPGEGEVAVRERAARVLRLDPLQLDLDRPLPLDSLQAVELRNRLEQDFGAAPPLEALLTGISPRQAGAALADSLAGLGDRTSGAAVEPVEGELLSHGQRALWLLHRLAPASPVHNLAVAARLRRPGGAPPGPDAVRPALGGPGGSACGSADSDGGDGRRPAASCSRGSDEVLDFAAVDEPCEPLSAWFSGQAHLPFDLARGPLVRPGTWRPRASRCCCSPRTM